MKRWLLLPLLLLPTLAIAGNWKVDPATSTLGFSGSFQGGAFHGVFKRFNADIRFNPAKLAQAKFDVTVDLASVDTQASERDDTLKGTDFFNVAKTPSAHFLSDRFSRDASGKITAHGALTLNGVTKPVQLAVTFTPAGAGATLAVTATLQRLDWNLGASPDWADISRAIKVQSTLHLTRD